MRSTAYQTTGVVVVKLDQRLDVAAFPIGSVHEVPRLFEPKLHVVSAPSPLPVTFRGQTLLRFSGPHEFIQAVT